MGNQTVYGPLWYPYKKYDGKYLHSSKYLLLCASEERHSYRFGSWNNLRVSKLWQDFHFWVNYPFKGLVYTNKHHGWPQVLVWTFLLFRNNCLSPCNHLHTCRVNCCVIYLCGLFFFFFFCFICAFSGKCQLSKGHRYILLLFY